MKKLLLVALASVSLFGADHNLYNHSLFLVGGYTVNSADTKLDDEFTIGLRYNYNISTVEGSVDIDALQFAFDYSVNNVYQNPAKCIVNGETSVFRLGVNALWYIENDSDFTPFILAGAGVQFFGENEAKDSNNMLFGTVGVGVEYQLRGDFSAVAELKAQFAGDGSSYVLGNVGVKYSFGQNYQRSDNTVPSTQVPVGTVIKY